MEVPDKVGRALARTNKCQIRKGVVVYCLYDFRVAISDSADCPAGEHIEYFTRILRLNCSLCGKRHAREGPCSQDCFFGCLNCPDFYDDRPDLGQFGRPSCALINLLYRVPDRLWSLHSIAGMP